MVRLVIAIAGAMLGCTAASPRASPAEAAFGSARAASSSAPADASASPAAAASSVAPAPGALAALPALPFSFSRVEATAATSLAVGKPPKVAFLLRGEALVFDGSGWARLPAPETREPGLAVDVFFGRDDQPRLMGFRRSPRYPNGESYYRRYKAGRFQPEPAELGPLAGSNGALYGVLGHADPEVVCRPGAFCVIKRTTGWGRASAHAEPVRVLLAGGTAWALHRDRIERLEGDAWVALQPEHAWETPISLFVDADGSPWVVEAKRDAVTHGAQGRWETTGVPLQGPRAIWGSSASDVWLVGQGGAAHFDGATWRAVDGVTGPLALVAYSPPELWLAGEAGVYRGVPTRPSAQRPLTRTGTRRQTPADAI